MKKRILLPLVLMFLAVSAYAADVVPPDTPPVTPPVAAVLEVAPVPDVVKMEGDKITVNDVVTDAKGVADAFKAYKTTQAAGNKLATRLGLMLLLAAIFKILLSCLKFTSEFWKGNKGKTALRLSTLVVGIAVVLLSHFGAGEGWVSAVLLGVSGPLAISFHELFDIIVGLVQKTPVPAVK
jgi:hypothetical protein